jgi:tetratricopeptide (TPR) repeat protein
MKNLDPVSRGRERNLVETVRNFLLVVRAFRQQQEKYRQGCLRFSDLAELVDDRGGSILFVLKENCHALFRRNECPVSEKEQIFDLIVGTLFHLSMKMREELYQLEFYSPKYTELKVKEETAPGHQSLVHQFQELIARAQSSFQSGMDEVGLLLREVLPHFQDLLAEHRENGLLIRFFLEEKDLLREVLGQNAREVLFQSIYGPQKCRPYRLGGESYLQSGFYAQAAQAFSLALDRNPTDQTLLFSYHLSQGLVQFYSFAPQEAVASLEKCLSFSAEKEVRENYRDMIRMVCQKIQEKFPGRRKGDQHRELMKKAKALQRQLEKLSPPSAGHRPTPPKK